MFRDGGCGGMALKTISVAEGMAAPRNNFDAIRLLAALLVLFSHSYPLTGMGAEPFAARWGGYDTGGGLAVSTFFTLSGFLVCRSAQRHDSWTYLRSRALRIVPGLAVCLVLTALVLGPFFTSLPAGRYFQDPAVWEHVLGLFVFSITTVIPGVFGGNPLNYFNGSLWTLPIEAAFYLVMPLLAAFGLLRRGVLALLTAALLACYLATPAWGLSWDNQGGLLVRMVPLFPAIKAACFFLIGACFWAFREEIQLSPGAAASCAIILAIAPAGHARMVVLLVCLPYLIFYAGLALPWALHLGKTIGDLSYGTYLYAFPVQQAVVALLGAGIGPILLTAYAAPPTLLLALGSWWLVEKPFLRARHGMRRYKAPAIGGAAPAERVAGE